MEALRSELAPTGRLRAAINLSNFLLVTGRGPAGEPEGVSPDVARRIARELGVEVELVAFDGPGEIADAAGDDVWDIANIAAEPERARTIAFGPPYCEIQATYLLPAGSALTDPEAVDSPGTRVAVKARAAYALWLGEHLRGATLLEAPSHEAAFARFVDEGLDALAGLRPKLLEYRDSLPGARVLDEPFTAVRQSIGCRPDRPRAARFLADFVERAVADGTIAALIERHGVSGRLSVARAREA